LGQHFVFSNFSKTQTQTLNSLRPKQRHFLFLEWKFKNINLILFDPGQLVKVWSLVVEEHSLISKVGTAFCVFKLLYNSNANFELPAAKTAPLPFSGMGIQKYKLDFIWPRAIGKKHKFELFLGEKQFLKASIDV
jgi:hypothetical protein